MNGLRAYAGEKPGQIVYRFPNGYGASVINDGYGKDRGLKELAVIMWIGDGPNDYRVDYDTPVTDDVLGFLTDEEVWEQLDLIEALNPREIARGLIARRIEKAQEAADEADKELKAAIAALAAFDDEQVSA